MGALGRNLEGNHRRVQFAPLSIIVMRVVTRKEVVDRRRRGRSQKALKTVGPIPWSRKGEGGVGFFRPRVLVESGPGRCM